MPAMLVLMNPSRPPYRLRSRKNGGPYGHHGATTMRQTVVLGSKVKAAIRAARKNPYGGGMTVDWAHHPDPETRAGFEAWKIREAKRAALEAQRKAERAAKRKEKRRKPSKAEQVAMMRLSGMTESEIKAFFTPRKTRKNPMRPSQRAKLALYGIPQHELDIISVLPASARKERVRELMNAVRAAKSLTFKSVRAAEREAHNIERKRSKMARRKRKNPSKSSVRALKKALARRNPGHYGRRHVRHNPKGDAQRKREETLKKLAALGLTPEMLAAVSSVVAPVRARGGGRAKLTEAEKEARKAQRKLASEGMKGAVEQIARRYYLGELSRADVDAIAADKRIRKGQARALASARKWIESGRLISKKRAEAFGFSRLLGAYEKARVPKGTTASKSAKVARAYLTAKRAVRGSINDPAAASLAKGLGLTALPNPGLKGFIDHLRGSVMMASAVVGGMVVVGWGLGISGLAPMIKKAYPTASKIAAPAAALGFGILGSYAMKMSPKTAKYSGMVLAGGAALAGIAILNTSWTADGKSLASKISENFPGLSGMGDYHMGMRVGDYHMGGEVAKLNVGDYHMGQIDVVTDRRMLAPPGEPMPRHDTRRDNVDESITAFTGSLAGDIFDA